MAIARGAGTEIIRSSLYKNVTSAEKELIYGIQHHIYTVLSIVVYCHVQNSSASRVYCSLVGYDVLGGTSGAEMRIFQQAVGAGETFVWNDKFSFNGTEPTGFAGTINSAADQDLIADQATATSQKLQIMSSHGSDRIEVVTTFIDQNNS